MRVPILTPLDTGGAYPGKATWTLEEWKKNVDDAARKDEELVEIMTDKAPLTVCAEQSGTLAEICIVQGEVFECDPSDPNDRVLLGYLEVQSTDTPAPVRDEPLQQDTSPASPSPPSDTDGEITAPNEGVKVTPVAKNLLAQHGIALDDLVQFLGEKIPQRIGKDDVLRYVDHLAARASQERMQGQPAHSSSRLNIAPPARKKMRELGITEEDVWNAGIHGSAPGGVIRVEDIIALRDGEREEQPTPTPPLPLKPEAIAPDPHAQGRSEVHPISSLQRTVARHIEEGWKKPTAQPNFRCDFSDVVSFRKWYGKKFEEATGLKLQLAFPFVSAIVRVLARDEFWRFNGTWKEENGSAVFIRERGVHIGLAFNTPDDDLIILTVHNAQEKTLPELARAFTDLQQKAVAKNYALRDVTGYSFIFNNVGGLQTLVPARFREKIVHASGYSLLTGTVSALLNLGALDADGKGMVQISFDHRILNGGHAMRFIVAVFEEMLDRVIPELQELCDRHT